MKFDGERFIPNECGGEIAIEHYQRYQFAKQLVSNKVVLDAACGEGYGSSLLAENAYRVYGVDIDEKVVDLANQKYGTSKLSYISASVAMLPFEESFFDIIISFETIEHIDEELQISFLKEIKRVLKPNGLLVMSTPNKAIYTDLIMSQNIFHKKEFYLREYQEFLGSYFENLEFYFQYPDTAYFIAKENECGNLEFYGKKGEESRYIIALCSDCKISNEIKTNYLIKFDNSMYYQLDMMTHKQSIELINMKKEADCFQAEQEKSINAQKDYIHHLETDLEQQREYIAKLESDTLEQREYIAKLESDTLEQREYIAKLESDTLEQREYIAKLESDTLEQREYIIKLELDRNEQGEFIEHLQKDIDELKKYIVQLEQ